MKAVDLHVHSSKSDGTFTPSELVDLALEMGLRGFALTDHDTVDGLDEALSYAKGKDIEVIPGIELSTDLDNKSIHIVGLFIDHHSPEFTSYLEEFKKSRTVRNEKICQLLREEAGMDITYEALLNEFPDSVITRAHYGKYMKKMGYVKSIPEAFERYIGDHAKYYVPREKISPEDGIKLILSAGGIPVFAHPILCGMSKSTLRDFTIQLKESGLKAIEAIYSTYAPCDERQIKELAKELSLAISGGSDFHGTNKPDISLGKGRGKMFIPEEILDNLKKLV